MQIARDAIDYLDERWQACLEHDNRLELFSSLCAAASIWSGAVAARWFPEKFPEMREAWDSGGEDAVTELVELMSYTGLSLYLCADIGLAAKIGGVHAGPALVYRSQIARRRKTLAKLVAEALDCRERQGSQLFGEIDSCNESWVTGGGSGLPFLLYWRALAALRGIWVAPSPNLHDPIQFMLTMYQAGHKELASEAMEGAMSGTLYIQAWLPITLEASVTYAAKAVEVGNLTFPFD